MTFKTTGRRRILLLLATVVALTAPARSSAQAGDTSFVTYPGWKRADRVSPAITPSVSYANTAKLWHYAYVISNGNSAAEDINSVAIQFSGLPQRATAPAGWDAMGFGPPALIPGATFSTVGESVVNVPGGQAAAPTAQQIRAGASASGFTIDSPEPPGYARYYVRGYAAVPFLPDSLSGAYATPHDTTDAQRGWTIGPTHYSAPVTQGTQETTGLARANKFLVFMNVDTIGSVLRNPAPIVVRFDDGSEGDLVCPETFRAMLNGVDVTSAFLPPIPGDNASLRVGSGTCDNSTPLRAAVFVLGPGSPLVAGANTLRTSVAGLPSTFSAGAIPSVLDVDVISFTIEP